MERLLISDLYKTYSSKNQTHNSAVIPIVHTPCLLRRECHGVKNLVSLAGMQRFLFLAITQLENCKSKRVLKRGALLKQPVTLCGELAR